LLCYSLIAPFPLSIHAAFGPPVALAFAGGFAIERVMIRPFEGSSVLTLVIVTLGLFSIINGLAGLIWGYVFKTFAGPFSTNSIQFGGVYLGIQDLGVIAVTLAVLSLVFALFRL